LTTSQLMDCSIPTKLPVAVLVFWLEKGLLRTLPTMSIFLFWCTFTIARYDNKFLALSRWHPTKLSIERTVFSRHRNISSVSRKSFVQRWGSYT
jgi:hypothetical protein